MWCELVREVQILQLVLEVLRYKKNGKHKEGPSEAAAGGGPPEGSISGDPGLRVVGKRGGGGGEV